METFYIKNKKSKIVAEVNFLLKTEISPDGENQYAYMISLLNLLPKDLKDVWLEGDRGDVLEKAVFEMMFSDVKNLSGLKKISLNENDILKAISKMISEKLADEIPGVFHKYYVMPKFSKDDSCGFCYTAASTFIFVNKKFNPLSLRQVVAHEYFHATIKHFDLLKLEKEGKNIIHENKVIKEQIIIEGLSDRFADYAAKSSMAKLYFIPSVQLKKILLKCEKYLDCEDEETYENIFLKTKTDFYPKKLNYGIGYYLGYYLAGILIRKYKKKGKVDWVTLSKKSKEDLFDESWNKFFNIQSTATRSRR